MVKRVLNINGLPRTLIVNEEDSLAKVLRGEMKKEDLIFKPVGNKILGTSFIRPSALKKVTGTWDYGADMALQMPSNTARLALVQADIPHANLKGIDYSEAEKMPGVYKVITAKDVKGKNRISGLITFANNKGDGWNRPILCDEKIFQIGDAVAIVAADTEEHARAAAKTVKLDLEPLPAYMSAMEAIADDAIEIHPGTPNIYYETNCINWALHAWHWMDVPVPLFMICIRTSLIQANVLLHSCMSKWLLIKTVNSLHWKEIIMSIMVLTPNSEIC